MARIPFEYWGFYDYPRGMKFFVHDHAFCLHSPFLEDEDEFADYYRVFELSRFSSKESVDTKCKDCSHPPPTDTSKYIGDIAIADLDFDKKHRGDIAAAPFRKFLTEHDYGFIYPDAEEQEKTPDAG